MSLLILLPVLIPFCTAILLLFAWNQLPFQRVVSVLGAIGLLAATVILLITTWSEGIQVIQIGSWEAPFGITFVADLFSTIMVTMNGLMGLAVVVYALADVDSRYETLGFHPLFHILLMGVSGAFLTGDMFNLYVWFEVMLIASFILLALGGQRNELEGAIKYVTLNLMASGLFLVAVGILYGLTGTLNMADLARQLPLVPQVGIVSVVAMLFLISFGIKAALFPLFGWLPASYHTPPAAVSAIFAGLLTKVGVYAIIRVFTLLFVQDVAFTHTVILVLAGLTMVTGVFGAASQQDFRRILSFHIVSQIGYMVMGLGLATTMALAGSVFYIMHHIIVKTNLFLISGIVRWLQGSNRLPELGGLYKVRPGTAVLFMIPAMSLAGIPPLSGFWAKLILIRAGLDAGQWAIVVTALGVSLLTLYSMTKIWGEVFWKAAPVDAPIQAGDVKQGWLRYTPVIVLATMTVIMGLAVNPLYQLAQETAVQLANPSVYIQAVLGGLP
ncbi:Na(+) H(+) antiporter subunit D [hydrothermal vent metagenome]|uniref:Na(+) H(+) antiporter subunit D n=1 Tax=hydrothermal vent metagenome TaxID=652676 RepID=A0A3B0V1T8_9ZZZZ